MQGFKRLVFALAVLVCCSPSEMRGQTGGSHVSLPDLEFDGQTTQTIGMYTLPQSFSFEAEVRVDASDQWRHLIEVGGVEYVWNSPFRLEVGNEGQWYVCIGDGYSYVESDFMGEWTYGVWTKVLFTYENGVGKFYENGRLLKEFTANKNVNAVQGSLILGSLQGNQRFFQGAMRNARLVEGTLAPSGTTTSQPPAGGTDPVAAPAISSDGHWVQGSGAVVWQLGWQAFTHVVATNNGVIYGVYPDGRLMWYRHDGYMTGTSQWVSTNGSQVGSGWDQFRLVFAGDQGVLYGVTPDGRLVWYKHDGYQDGSNVWAPGSGNQVGSGWHIYDQVITGNKGLMYGIATDGKLFWYQHTGYLEGSGNWASGSGVQVVGTGWQSAQPAMGGDDGLIYAVMNGELKWYQRPNPESATENWVHDNGMSIGTGWQVKSVFAGDEGTIYAVMPSGELRWYRYNYGLKDDPAPTGSTLQTNSPQANDGLPVVHLSGAIISPKRAHIASLSHVKTFSGHRLDSYAVSNGKLLTDPHFYAMNFRVAEWGNAIFQVQLRFREAKPEASVNRFTFVDGVAIGIGNDVVVVKESADRPVVEVNGQMLPGVTGQMDTPRFHVDALEPQTSSGMERNVLVKIKDWQDATIQVYVHRTPTGLHLNIWVDIGYWPTNWNSLGLFGYDAFNQSLDMKITDAWNRVVNSGGQDRGFLGVPPEKQLIK